MSYMVYTNNLINHNENLEKQGGEIMFMGSSILLEGVVLSAVSEKKDGIHGYKIYKKINGGIAISESAIYQMLHKLCSKGYISASSEVLNGRNRKIYIIKEKGEERLSKIKNEWYLFSKWFASIL